MPLNKTKKLHIVSFNVPFPADYGGVIGVFYHIKALKTLGVEIMLHCFQYGRATSIELDEVCSEVHYYPRDMSLVNMFSSLPFIVKSRKSEELMSNLLKDDYPILFEGSHVCYHLGDIRLRNRKKIVRMHNVEWQYYANMIALESDFKKKIYFALESKKLKAFELNNIKKYANALLAVSPKETSYFNDEGFENVHYVSAFHSNDKIESIIGKGSYVLFHGDLSVKENELIAIDLITKVFNKLPEIELIIAGRSPSKSILDLISKTKNVALKNDISNDEMDALIKNAHINLLRAYQPAGMKLKLLNALYKGRHVLVNSNMVKNTGLDSLCIIIEDIKDVPSQIKEIMLKPFDEIEIHKRKNMLEKQFSNVEKAKTTLSLI